MPDLVLVADGSEARIYRLLRSTVDGAPLQRRARGVIVIAEPQMLGVLRKELAAATCRVMRREGAKDMTHGTAREIHALAIARD